ncbi:MAG: DUF6567 family protein [Verrucomicrobiota bacterium]
MRLAPIVIFISLFGAIAFVTGCSTSSGNFDQKTATDVRLAGNNYRLIKGGAIGTSAGFRFLGFLPITSPSYSVAKQRLYKSVGEDLRGRSIALANQTQDSSQLYVILFSIPRITVTADVIEFVDQPPGKSSDK